MSHRNQDIQDQILFQALKDVPFEGWTWSVIEKAAEEAGFNKDMAFAVFPAGISEVLQHFSGWADREMLAALKDVDIDTLRVRDRVRLGVEKRLQVLEPHKEAVRAASVYWLVPFRKLQAGRIVWKTADQIWIWAGDEATDYNHYTKRGLLCGVLTTTTLAWLNDTSDNHKETLDFLDRRIDNVLKIGKAAGKLLRGSGGFTKRKTGHV